MANAELNPRLFKRPPGRGFEWLRVVAFVALAAVLATGWRLTSPHLKLLAARHSVAGHERQALIQWAAMKHFPANFTQPVHFQHGFMQKPHTYFGTLWGERNSQYRYFWITSDFRHTTVVHTSSPGYLRDPADWDNDGNMEAMIWFRHVPMSSASAPSTAITHNCYGIFRQTPAHIEALGCITMPLAPGSRATLNWLRLEPDKFGLCLVVDQAIQGALTWSDAGKLHISKPFPPDVGLWLPPEGAAIELPPDAPLDEFFRSVAQIR